MFGARQNVRRLPAGEACSNVDGVASLCTPFRGIAFVHLPKTAGTSFRHQLHDALGPVYIDSTDPFFAPPTVMEPAQVMQSGVYSGLSGHVPASKYAAAAKENNWALITFIREPMARACSHYAHLINRCWDGTVNKDWHFRFCEQKPSFLEFLSDRAWPSNVYELFCDIPVERFDFIGVAEEYEQSIAAFNTKFGTGIRVSRENVTKFAYRPSESERQEAEKFLVREREIYEQLRSRRTRAEDAEKLPPKNSWRLMQWRRPQA